MTEKPDTESKEKRGWLRRLFGGRGETAPQPVDPGADASPSDEDIVGRPQVSELAAEPAELPPATEPAAASISPFAAEPTLPSPPEVPAPEAEPVSTRAEIPPPSVMDLSASESVEAEAPRDPAEISSPVAFEPEVEALTEPEKPDEQAQRAGWFTKLKRGLSRSSAKLTGGITGLFTKRKLDEAAIEELEELLITADLGVGPAARISQSVAKTRFNQEVSAEEVRGAVASEIAEILKPVAQTITIRDVNKPHVILVCGVNGSGKTTTIAKMAHLFKLVGFKVMLAAGDTFRAAAIEQLQIWGDRVGCPVISRAPGSDAASLAFEAFERARADEADVLLIDTAGRLQNKTDLMAELQKIVRVLKKKDETAPHDCLLVLDSTVGQNAHNQVQIFNEMVTLTGLAVTKLDGSAKGGVVVALAERFGLPVYLIGVGEGMDDMRAFDPREFARSLLGLEA